MESDLKKLNRFTTIPFLIDLLKRKKLTLLNPKFWEDYNDRETVEIYRKQIKAESVYALCLTHESETVHHWNAFASGTNGCCIEFSPGKLFSYLNRLPGFVHGRVKYLPVNSLSKTSIEVSDLPFVKRYPFEPEKEYRLIVTSNEKQLPAFDINIDVNVIRRITISNNLPQTTFESLKEILALIEPNYKGGIYHSTLYNNTNWINHFSKKRWE